mmetsp:Transcript_102776/g.331621  ORF Transcript_102776/g.331621 Transcript_102776/m.331621 type:complete len:214 (-) Transcript_102776:7-648(-)
MSAASLWGFRWSGSWRSRPRPFLRRRPPSKLWHVSGAVTSRCSVAKAMCGRQSSASTSSGSRSSAALTATSRLSTPRSSGSGTPGRARSWTRRCPQQSWSGGCRQSWCCTASRTMQSSSHAHRRWVLPGRSPCGRHCSACEQSSAMASSSPCRAVTPPCTRSCSTASRKWLQGQCRRTRTACSQVRGGQPYWPAYGRSWGSRAEGCTGPCGWR